LPERFGVYNRFNNWAKRGLWRRIFDASRFEEEPIASILDASVVRAHQDASGGKGGSNAMLWAALEEVFQPKSTPSSTRKRGRFTSR
jgi:transposase